MIRKNRVLLIVYNAAHFRELSRLAKVFIDSGMFVPLMLFVSPYPNMSEHCQQCSRLGVQAWIRGQPLQPTSHKAWAPALLLLNLPLKITQFIARLLLLGLLPSIAVNILRRITKLASSLYSEILSYIQTIKLAVYSKLRSSDSLIVQLLRAYRQLSYARIVCRTLRPDLVVLAEDNVEYISGAWVRAAHRIGIPVMIVPYCLAGLDEPAAVYANDVRHQADIPENRPLVRSYPQWVYEYQGRRLVRMPAHQALPLEWLGISSPLPWLMNGTYADVIAVESPFMRDYYLKQGVAREQIVLTGTAGDDAIHESLQNISLYREQLYACYGMLTERPMILCALPPITSAMAALREEFSSYAEMLRFWLDCLREIENFNIFISLHPTMSREDFAFLDELGWWGMALAPPDTARMIALCDIYIASVSSTIRWAIACGKPVINYDVYRFRFPDYRPARGVVTVERKEEFRQVLHRITSDKQYYEALRLAQIECQAYWGMIDGKSSLRLINLAEHLIEKRQVQCRKSAPERFSKFIGKFLHSNKPAYSKC